MSTEAWLIDAFGPWSFLVLTMVTGLLTVAHRAFVWDHIMDWVHREPGRRSSRAAIVAVIHLVVIVPFLYFSYMALGW